LPPFRHARLAVVLALGTVAGGLLLGVVPDAIYEFADPSAPPLIPAPPDFNPGASHAADLFYLFDLPGKPLRLDGSTYPLTTAQHRVADTMITAWSTFAKTGKPGDWPAGARRRSASTPIHRGRVPPKHHDPGQQPPL